MKSGQGSKESDDPEIPIKGKGPEDEGGGSPKKKRVKNKKTVKVKWDPWEQKWLSIIEVENGSQEYWYRYSDDFPMEYDGENDFANPKPWTPTDQPNEEDGGSTGEPDSNEGGQVVGDDLPDETFSSTIKDALSNADSSAPFHLEGTGYALDSPLLEGSTNVSSWIGSSYMLFSGGGKPLGEVHQGSEVSGSFLNMFTGTNDYDPGLTYVITAIRPQYWDSSGGPTTQELDWQAGGYFINRTGKRGKDAVYTPQYVHTSVEARMKHEQQTGHEQQSNFCSQEDLSIFDAADLPEGSAKVAIDQILNATDSNPYWTPPQVVMPQGTPGYENPSPFGINLATPTLPDLGIKI